MEQPRGAEQVERRVAVVVPAAGSGRRMGAAENKALLPLAGMPVVARAVAVFQNHPAVERIVVVGREADLPALQRLFADSERWSRVLAPVAGGEARQDSVYAGLEALAAAGAPPDWVLVHDAARPLCSPALLQRVLDALREHEAVVPVVPVTDTLRRAGPGGGPAPGREELLRVQTPQGFHWAVLRRAHTAAREQGLAGTDDAQLAEVAGYPPALVQGEEANLKVTTPHDLRYAEWLLTHEPPP